MKPMSDRYQTCPYRFQHGLPEIIRAFKSFSARRIKGKRRINAMRRSPGVAIWQRNYFEHTIRNEAELNCIHEYICYNPTQWETDQENPGWG